MVVKKKWMPTSLDIGLVMIWKTVLAKRISIINKVAKA
jgi:hypothetical protein